MLPTKESLKELTREDLRALTLDSNQVNSATSLISKLKLSLRAMYGLTPSLDIKTDFEVVLDFYIKSTGVPLSIFSGNAVKESAIKKIVEGYKNQIDVQAKTRLAYCYTYGIGIEKDLQKGAQLFTQAADENYAPAQYQRGMICYLKNNSVNPDDDNLQTGIVWLTKAADQKYAPAECSIGVCYLINKGVKPSADNPKIAVGWFSKAAEQGYAPAQYLLGKCYLQNNGVNPGEDNPKTGVSWLIKAADRNYAPAQYDLGNSYLTSKHIHSSNNNSQIAITWLTKAAEQDNFKALDKLIESYSLGINGIEKDITRATRYCLQKAKGNHQEAFTLFYQTAHNNNNMAHDNNTAAQSALGCNPSEANPRTSIELLRKKSAEQNYAMAQYLLGNNSLTSEYVDSSDNNPQTAITLLTTAAEQGHPMAVEKLIKSYSLGVNGAEKDIIRTAKYCLQKAKGNHREAFTLFYQTAHNNNNMAHDNNKVNSQKRKREELNNNHHAVRSEISLEREQEELNDNNNDGVSPFMFSANGVAVANPGSVAANNNNNFELQGETKRQKLRTTD